MEKTPVFNRETLVPVGMITGGAVLLVSVVFWFAMSYADQRHTSDQQKVFDDRLRSVETRQSVQDQKDAKNDERLRNIETNVLELREDVKKLLTAQPLSRTR